MGIADQLGLDSLEAPALAQARQRWVHWCECDPDLAVVDDLAELPTWTRHATTAERDAVLAHLAALAVDERYAAVVLAWLLIPGAVRLADRLRDLSPDIDTLVAGQLWLEVRSHGGIPAQAVAFTILQNTKRAVLAEHGIGDAAKRGDRTWAHTITTDRIDEYARPAGEEEPGARLLLCSLVWRMLHDGALTAPEAGVLASAAQYADWLSVPLRGRAGVTAPGALEVLTWLDPSKSRTMRRNVGKLLDRIAVYAREHGIQIDNDVQRLMAGDDWTFGEFVMIATRPALAATLRRFHHIEQVRIRCPAPDSVPDSAASAAPDVAMGCACAAMGGCLAQALEG